ncbi:hypothetical protein GCM10017744_035330 [Streptomyces antimycoticus]
MNSQLRRAISAALLGSLALGALVGCGEDSQSGADSKTVTLVTHDSFAASKAVLKEFTKETGYKVRVQAGGDAGAAVNQAILSKGHPQGDVFFGVDNTLLSRALDNDLFTPFTAKGLDKVPAALQLDRAEHRVTPVDFGDICVNYDRKYFADKKLTPPRTLEDLTKPAYKNLLVTENAATSSPVSASSSPRPPSTATTAGRATGRSCGPTVSRSSTAGSRRITTGSPARPAAARATGRSSSPTHRARPPRWPTPRPSPPRPPPGWRRAPVSGRWSSPGC